MKTSLPLRSLSALLSAAAILCAHAVAADASKSLLPVFSTDGVDFTTKAANGHIVHGWLPAKWTDNTEWAPVSASYTKLTDGPVKAVGAVRIKVEKIDEGGQLQLTSYDGIQKYKKGTTYIARGWIRSADGLGVNVGTRQIDEPYETYHEKDLTTGPEWKRFEFAFTPEKDFSAFLMFFVRQTGTVDLAGMTLEEKP